MKIDLATIIKKFNALDIKVRYGIFAFILIFVIAFDYFLILNFQLGFIKNSNQEISTLETDTARVKADKQRIDQMRKGLENTRSQLKAMNVKIRSTQEVAAVLEDISRLANEAGVKIDQLIPRKDIQETVITSEEGNFYAMPIVIQARCGYHVFGRFLNRLEGANLYFSVSDLRIDADVKDRNNHLITTTLKVILTDKEITEAKKS